MPTPPPPETRAQSSPHAVRVTSSNKPTVIFDWRDWLPYLNASPASDDQKRALIETYWAIILSFVDLGFEVIDDPARDPLTPENSESCGQVMTLTDAMRAAVLNSKDNPAAEREER